MAAEILRLLLRGRSLRPVADHHEPRRMALVDAREDPDDVPDPLHRTEVAHVHEHPLVRAREPARGRGKPGMEAPHVDEVRDHVHPVPPNAFAQDVRLQVVGQDGDGVGRAVGDLFQAACGRDEPRACESTEFDEDALPGLDTRRDDAPIDTERASVRLIGPEEQVSERISRFVVEPLEPGFGYTVGNAMRRTLLSSVPGAAIVSHDLFDVTVTVTGLSVR